jgi:hypothetical protein
MHRIPRAFFIYSVCTLFIFVNCGGIEPDDPTGFGTWADDCSGIAVALNRQDWDSRPLMDHETNMRSDLYLCDTNGVILETLFTERKVDGGESSIDSLEYYKSYGYIIVYSVLYGKGQIKKEKIYLSNKVIELVEYIDGVNWSTYSSRHDLSKCNGKSISWNSVSRWIEVK